MQSVASEIKHQETTAKLIVVLCKQYERDARRILDEYAHATWEACGFIKLLIRPDNLWRFGPETAFELRKIAPPEGAARVVILGKMDCNANFGIGKDYRSLNTFSDVRTFGKGIYRILQQSGLDWRSLVCTELKSWHHNSISNASITNWLEQFARLGYPWIGEYLLRSLDFWSPERLKMSINIATSSTFERICLKRNQPGKSGDFLANILRKQMNGLGIDKPIEDFREVFEATIIPKSILFIEDCLLTGTEITNFLSSLLGLPAPGRPWRISPLRDRSALFKSQIELRFAAVTSLGITRLEKFLKDHQLNNIKISFNKTDFIEVLTNTGEEALNKNSFFDQIVSNCPVDPDNHIDRIIFRSPWETERKKQQTEAFCRDVGLQLFRNYLDLKGYIWDERKIRISGLGMHGLGLSTVFSHSIPKATLPLFWGKGKVCYRGAKSQWLPLFEDGAL